jgi:hypothetical protein
MNEGLTQTEQDLVEMLDKQAHTELMLGEKINSTLLNKAIEMIHTIAKERAYWQFKAECYKKDLTKLNADIDKLYEDKWTDRGNYE